MQLSVRTVRKYSYIVYPSEVVVYDDCGNAVVKCPTEQEAKEYIKESGKVRQRMMTYDNLCSWRCVKNYKK